MPACGGKFPSRRLTSAQQRAFMRGGQYADLGDQAERSRQLELGSFGQPGARPLCPSAGPQNFGFRSRSLIR